MLPRWLWIFGLGGLVIAAVVAVTYKPGLRLPDQEQFQLFHSGHPFERYDLWYKRFFGFEKQVQSDISLRMPLRFLWGVRPVDNGEKLNPGEMGTLELDPDFDISTPEAQK